MLIIINKWKVSLLLLYISILVNGGCYKRKETDRSVDVGGYKLQYQEYGVGNPPVIFLNGGTAKMEYWKGVAQPVSKFTKVILYERAGHEKSELGKIPRDGINIADELHALLDNLEVGSPYVLVAHSAGSMYARVFASRYAADVAGLVLLDPGDKDFLDEFGIKYLSGEDQEKWVDYWDKTWDRCKQRADGFGMECQEKEKTIEQMQNSKLSTQLIYYVLSGVDESRPDYFIEDYRDEVKRKFFEFQLKYHLSLVKEFPRGELIKVEDSQHVIHADRPDLVISVIKTVIEASKIKDEFIKIHDR